MSYFFKKQNNEKTFNLELDYLVWAEESGGYDLPGIEGGDEGKGGDNSLWIEGDGSDSPWGEGSSPCVGEVEESWIVGFGTD